MKDSKTAASLWIRLAKCYGLVLQEVRRGNDGYSNVTLPQFDALAQLLRHPRGMTASELSHALLVTKGNVTGIIARLQGRRFLTRTSSPEDRRAAVLKLTSLGRRLAKAHVQHHERRLQRIFRGLNSSDQVRIRTALDRLRSTIERRQNGRRHPYSRLS